MADDEIDMEGSERIEAFRALWKSKCPDGGLPARADFSHEDLQPWFGDLMLLDVRGAVEDFRYRLVGTNIVEFLGRDLTGAWVSQCDYGESRESVWDTFTRPVHERRPVTRRGPVLWVERRTWCQFESVHCPLASDGRTVDRTIGVLLFHK